jgi:hypothetical protein
MNSYKNIKNSFDFFVNFRCKIPMQKNFCQDCIKTAVQAKIETAKPRGDKPSAGCKIHKPKEQKPCGKNGRNPNFSER